MSTILPYSQHVNSTAQALDCYARCVFDPCDITEERLIPSRAQDWHRASELPAQAEKLLARNWQKENIYIGGNPRRATGGSQAEDVLLARCLFADFDDGCTVEQARDGIACAQLPEPTLLLASGHGIHAYWRLTEPLFDLAAWTLNQKRLIATLGSDKNIHDPPRIMRLPGFWNVKEEPYVPCFIVAGDPSRRYTLASLVEIQRSHCAVNRFEMSRCAPPVEPPFREPMNLPMNTLYVRYFQYTGITR